MLRDIGLQSLVERLVRWRYVVLGIAALAIWVDTLNVAGGEGADWHFFLAGAHGLATADGLHVYARMPYLQFGPLALLVGVIFRDLGPHHGWVVVSGLGMLLGVASVRVLERAATALGGEASGIGRCVLFGGPFFLAAWASPAVSEGHPDDVLALVALSTAVWAVATRRWLVAAVLVGLATACKPWAALVLPLAAACSGRRVRGAVVATGAAIVPWLPFFAADLRTRRIAQLHLPIEAGSSLHYLGLQVGTTPGWPREVQLVVALVLGGLAVVRSRWILVPLIAFSVRINLDPAAIDYYAAGPVLGALLWDLTEPIRGWPVRTDVVWVALLYVPSDLLTVGASGAAYGALVVALRAAVLAVAVLAASRGVKPRGREPAMP